MKVAIGVILDSQQRVLITKRGHNTPQSGLWEFPGGKVKDRELPIDALIREILEEVGLNVINPKFLMQINHKEPCSTESLSLLVYIVRDFNGVAKCLESQQDMRWVKTSDLHKFTFPKANLELINMFSDDIKRVLS